MTIVLTGGGSGGHITPVLAIADELKRLKPDIRIVYIGQKGDSLSDIPRSDPNIDQVFIIRAGKYRRYNGEGLKQLLDIKTIYLNIRDIFFVIIGLYQSWKLMKTIQPKLVFSRGGFVSVPVVFGAKLRGIKYVTHDSDSTPSLANKIIAKWATLHAVAMDKKLYPYAEANTVTTGIPLNKHFIKVTSGTQKKYREDLKVPLSAFIIFVIGGGLGSQDVNAAVADAVPHLLDEYENLYIFHAAGRGNDAELQALYESIIGENALARVKVFSFIPDVYKYSGAADLVITRAGATNLAEFAVQGKPCIVIPSTFLAGGHQLKNAEYLKEQGAIEVIQSKELLEDPNRLSRLVNTLIKSKAKREELSINFSSLAQPNATNHIAKLLLELL